jgi:catechol 2,3-dioxygenase-like lactoylglutathione lyase family enzyme
MQTHIGQIALLVNDYDEAIEYFVNVLQFSLVEDTILSDKKRKHPQGSFSSNTKKKILLLKQ